MDRRSFLAGLGATIAARAAALPQLKIAAVEVIRLEGHREVTAGVDPQFQANPLHVYDELRPAPYRDSANPTKRSTTVSALYLKIRTDQGLDGLYGPIDKEVAIVVLDQLRPFL